MAKPPLPRPTDSELAILRVIWRIGPATVREVHEQIQPDQQVGYTTILKLLQIMADKGLVTRDETQRAHVYAAAVPAESTQRQLVGDLVEKAFGGSPLRLVMSALSDRKADEAELSEVRALLERLEKERA